MPDKIKKQKGFTLAELLIAVFVLTTGVIGAYLAVQQSVNIASNSSLRSTAAYLAQEGIEIIRNIRDTNFLEGDAWNEGLDIDGNYQADYTTPRINDPILLACNNPCDYSSVNLRFLKKNNLDLYNYSLGSDTLFKRKISLQKSGASQEILKITVTVYWRDKTGAKNFSAQENLYDWF